MIDYVVVINYENITMWVFLISSSCLLYFSCTIDNFGRAMTREEILKLGVLCSSQQRSYGKELCQIEWEWMTMRIVHLMEPNLLIF